jgi:hypothetical protein
VLRRLQFGTSQSLPSDAFRAAKSSRNASLLANPGSRLLWTVGKAWIADMGAKSAGATTALRAHGVLSGILHRQRGEHLAAMGTVGEAPGANSAAATQALRHIFYGLNNVMAKIGAAQGV